MKASSSSAKKLSRRVRPGVELVRARLRRAHRRLMALDLPALERPTKATSLPWSGGRPRMAAALVRKRAWLKFMSYPQQSACSVTGLSKAPESEARRVDGRRVPGDLSGYYPGSATGERPAQWPQSGMQPDPREARSAYDGWAVG